jgi:hypothetical protein
VTAAPSRPPAPLTDAAEKRTLTTLKDLLDAPRAAAWDLDQRYTVILAIARFMNFLHSWRVCHNALSLQSILVDDMDCLKIIGFDRATLDEPVDTTEEAEADDPFRESATADVVAFRTIVKLLIEPLLRRLPLRNMNPWSQLKDRCKLRSPTFAEIVETLEGPDFRRQINSDVVEQRMAKMMRSSRWEAAATEAVHEPVGAGTTQPADETTMDPSASLVASVEPGA